MRERVEGRDPHDDREAGVEVESDDQRNRREDTYQQVTKQKTEKWRDIHQEETCNGNCGEGQTEAHASEEILGDAADEIANPSVTAYGDKILGNTATRTA